MPAVTLREHLEAIRNRLPDCPHIDCTCDDCLIAADAEAALAILDEAELISEYRGGDATEKTNWRYVLDAEPTS